MTYFRMLGLALALLVSAQANAQESPPAQRQMVQTITDHARRYANAPHSLARTSIRSSRALALCQMASASQPRLQVSNFLGIIKSINSSLEKVDGAYLAVVEVYLGPDIIVRSASGTMSDEGARTLISRTNPIYNQLTDMHMGQRVQFSGSFISDNDDCFKEVSLTEGGGMQMPEFMFRFTDLRAIGP